MRLPLKRHAARCAMRYIAPRLTGFAFRSAAHFGHTWLERATFEDRRNGLFVCFGT
jgi:hypothetical protein